MEFRYRNWTAPLLSQLDFSTNCTLAAQWVQTWYSGSAGVLDNVVARYFRNALPPELKTVPTQGQIIDWYHAALLDGYNHTWSNGSNLFLEYVVIRPREICQDEVCAAIPWEGTPDITGVGILSSYFIQAALTTIYAIFITVDHRRRSRNIVSSRHLQRIFDACKASLNTFIDAAQFFSLFVTIGAIYIAAQHAAARNNAEVSLAQDMTFFSMYAVLFLLGLDDLAYGNLKRRDGRWLLFVFLIILTIVEGWVGSWLSRSTGETWEIFCGFDLTYQEKRMKSILSILTFALYWFWIALLYFLPRALESFNPRVSKILRTRRKYTVALGIIYLAALMWAFLIVATFTRQRILERSGFNTRDIVWTFGQVMALGTWLPVLLEVFYLFRMGIHHALQDRVPDPWIVSNPGEKQKLSTPTQGLTNQLQIAPTEPEDSHGEDQGLLMHRVHSRSPSGVSRHSQAENPRTSVGSIDVGDQQDDLNQERIPRSFTV